jgi:hypothetical protein
VRVAAAMLAIGPLTPTLSPDGGEGVSFIDPAHRSTPKYAAMTAGSVRTSAGGPSAILRP